MFDATLASTWAKIASDSFIEKEVPIKKSVATIAHKHDLNQNQIQRICELANQLTYTRLFNKVSDKTFTFPTTDLSEVLEELKDLRQPPVDTTFNAQPSIPRSVDTDRIMDMFGSPEVMDMAPREHNQRVTIVLEKMASAETLLMNKLIVAEAAASGYLKDLYSTVKNLILDGYTRDDLFAAMLISFPERKIELMTMFADITKKLVEDGVKVASASEPVDEQYISKLLGNYGVRVVNGQHPLYLVIRDFFSKADERLAVEGGTQWIGKKIQELKNCIKK
jgi:hypothetical protein